MSRTSLPPLLTLLCSLLWTGAASARLGESREDCIKRYGQPVAEIPALLESATGAAFQKGEVRIRIEFLGGKAAFLSFSRRGLRQDEQQTLLEVNAGTLVWNPPADFVGRTCWVAQGNAQEATRVASAYQLGGTGFLDLATDAWAKAMKAQQAVQFAVQSRPAPSAVPPVPGPKAPPAPAAGGKLDGF